MADRSKIEWTDATWTPVKGCSRASEGCRNCYAEIMAARFSGPGQWGEGLARIVETPAGKDHRWTGDLRFDERELLKPLSWSRPRMVFVCSTSDLFHERVPDAWIDRAFAVMALAPQHTFQVLTKRPERMRAYLSAARSHPVGLAALELTMQCHALDPGSDVGDGIKLKGDIAHLSVWPLPNVWLGTSVEDQVTADVRIPYLLETPAAVRWISAEPLIGPVDFKRWCPTMRWAHLKTGERKLLPAFYMTRCEHCGWAGSSELCGTDSWGDDSDVYCPGCNRSIAGNDFGGRIDWIVAGGESGPGARPMHPDWVRSIRDQCAEADVPFFFKQWGAWAALQSGDGSWTTDSETLCRLSPDNSRTDDGWPMQRVGKSAAGRILDGRTHDAFPPADEVIF